MRNPCKDCIYYHKENRTCQSKKCATGGSGKVSWIDKLFCAPCKKRWTVVLLDEYQKRYFKSVIEICQNLRGVKG